MGGEVEDELEGLGQGHIFHGRPLGFVVAGARECCAVLGYALVEAVCQLVLGCDGVEVDVGVVGQQEEDSTREEFIVCAVRFQSFCCFCCEALIDHNLS